MSLRKNHRYRTRAGTPEEPAEVSRREDPALAMHHTQKTPGTHLAEPGMGTSQLKLFPHPGFSQYLPEEGIRTFTFRHRSLKGPMRM